MKKLFFLCAFLFMSMQMQAQVYIVIIQQESLNAPLYQSIISPNGDIVKNIVNLESSAYVSLANHLDIGMLAVSSTLNEIMKNGYTLLAMPLPYEPTSSRSGAIRAVYYLIK